TLPFLVFTMNHFAPPAPMIAAIGNGESPSAIDSTTSDDSSGIVNTGTAVFSCGDWLDAPRASVRLKEIIPTKISAKARAVDSGTSLQ
ncbi:MAG TPA: hypothetical protein VFY96_10515, partial [Candidatus Binatia bacterium]|nr:hypothetical protein [Candidatus Binatia bacterium]